MKCMFGRQAEIAKVSGSNTVESYIICKTWCVGAEKGGLGKKKLILSLNDRSL